MPTVEYTREQLVDQAKLKPEDLIEINRRRRPDTQLGFAYQLAFVRFFNRFPVQQPFEIDQEILTFVCLQLDLPSDLMGSYGQRQPTISDHREHLIAYLNLHRLGEAEIKKIRDFLFEEACRLEQTSALLSRATVFLKEHQILQSADDTLLRLIRQTRDQARQHIYRKISDQLPAESLCVNIE